MPKLKMPPPGTLGLQNENPMHRRGPPSTRAGQPSHRGKSAKPGRTAAPKVAVLEPIMDADSEEAAAPPPASTVHASTASLDASILDGVPGRVWSAPAEGKMLVLNVTGPCTLYIVGSAQPTAASSPLEPSVSLAATAPILPPALPAAPASPALSLPSPSPSATSHEGDGAAASPSAPLPEGWEEGDFIGQRAKVNKKLKLSSDCSVHSHKLATDAQKDAEVIVLQTAVGDDGEGRALVALGDAACTRGWLTAFKEGHQNLVLMGAEASSADLQEGFTERDSLHAHDEDMGRELRPARIYAQSPLATAKGAKGKSGQSPNASSPPAPPKTKSPPSGPKSASGTSVAAKDVPLQPVRTLMAEAAEKLAAAAEFAAQAEAASSSTLERKLGMAILAKNLNVEDMIRLWDNNGDGEVSKGEFRQAVRASFHLKADNKQIEELFERMDTDHGGTLDHEELHKALQMVRDSAAAAAEEEVQMRHRASAASHRAANLIAAANAVKAVEVSEAKLRAAAMDKPLGARIGAVIVSKVKLKGLPDVTRSWDADGNGLMKRSSFKQLVRAALDKHVPEDEYFELELDALYDSLAGSRAEMGSVEVRTVVKGLVDLEVKRKEQEEQLARVAASQRKHASRLQERLKAEAEAEELSTAKVAEEAAKEQTRRETKLTLNPPQRASRHSSAS